jgi:hypothetical protein
MKQLLNRKLTYIVTLVITLAMPLVWIIPTYLSTVPGPCRPNWPAFLACASAGYFVPASFGPCAAVILVLIAIQIYKIIKTKW